MQKKKELMQKKKYGLGKMGRRKSVNQNYK